MSDIWRTLGVSRGSDERTIRRAYARRLKETNPEDDAAGFQALRQAYETAMAQASSAAARGGPEDEAGEVPADILASAEGNEIACVADSVTPDAQPVAALAAEGERGEDQARALQQAFHEAFARGDAAGAPELLEALLASPATDNLLFRARLETWIAELIVEYLPQSDVLVDRAVAHFGWSDDAIRSLPDAVHAVSCWLDERWWIEDAANPTGEFALGWQALSNDARPTGRTRLAALRPGIVGQAGLLLHVADTQLPILYRYFDAGSVAWWRNFLVKGRFSLATLGLSALGLLFAVIVDINLELTDLAAGARSAIAAGLCLAAIAAPILYVRFLKPAPTFFVEERWLAPREAWLLAPLTMLAAALAVPPGAPGELLTLAGVSLVGAWTWRANPMPPSRVRFLDRLRATLKRYWLFGGYVLLHGTKLSGDRAGQWFILAAGLLFSWHHGAPQAKQFLIHADPRSRSAILTGIIAVLVICGISLARSAPLGEGAYYASVCSLGCLGLLLLIGATERQGPRMFFMVLGWFAVIALWTTATGHSVPREPRTVPADSLTQKPPPPWIPPACPKVDRDAPLPSPPIPCGKAGWMRDEDYPWSALQREAEGTVETEIELSDEGRINRCRVVRSSGHDDLDEATCAFQRERARFLPARDETGAPIGSTYTLTMRWQIER